MNPVNRLKPVEFGGNFNTPKMTKLLQGADDMVVDLQRTAQLTPDQSNNITRAFASLKRALREGNTNGVNRSYEKVINELGDVPVTTPNIKILINQIYSF